jgi:hypothetical protein
MNLSKLVRLIDSAQPATAEELAGWLEYMVEMDQPRQRLEEIEKLFLCALKLIGESET